MECDPEEIAFLQAQIVAVEAQIIAYQAASLALGSGVASYEINTGQTTQRVTKVDLLRLANILDSLLNRRAVLKQLLTGRGSTHIVPGW